MSLIEGRGSTLKHSSGECSRQPTARTDRGDHTVCWELISKGPCNAIPDWDYVQCRNILNSFLFNKSMFKERGKLCLNGFIRIRQHLVKVKKGLTRVRVSNGQIIVFCDTKVT